MFSAGRQEGRKINKPESAREEEGCDTLSNIFHVEFYPNQQILPVLDPMKGLLTALESRTRQLRLNNNKTKGESFNKVKFASKFSCG